MAVKTRANAVVPKVLAQELGPGPLRWGLRLGWAWPARRDQQALLVQPGSNFVPTPEVCNPPILDNVATCRSLNNMQEQLREAQRDLSSSTSRNLWSHPIGWVMYWLSADTIKPDSPPEQLVTVVIGVFTNYTVPMMFGLLGTLAGVVRTIWAKSGVALLDLRTRDSRWRTCLSDWLRDWQWVSLSREGRVGYFRFNHSLSNRARVSGPVPCRGVLHNDRRIAEARVLVE